MVFGLFSKKQKENSIDNGNSTKKISDNIIGLSGACTKHLLNKEGSLNIDVEETSLFMELVYFWLHIAIRLLQLNDEESKMLAISLAGETTIWLEHLSIMPNRITSEEFSNMLAQRLNEYGKYPEILLTRPSMPQDIKNDYENFRVEMDQWKSKVLLYKAADNILNTNSKIMDGAPQYTKTDTVMLFLSQNIHQFTSQIVS